MHELGLAREIVAVACECIDGGSPTPARGRAIVRVVVEVGDLALVVPESLHFCYDLVTRDTPAAGSTLELIRVPGRARCRSCGAEFAANTLVAACSCGSVDLHWLSGHELRIKEMEVR